MQVFKRSPKCKLKQMNYSQKKKEKEEKSEIPEKLFFSIGEVSKITHLPTYVIRFWESKFKEIKPQKSRGGHRRYRKKDVELILWVKKLLYEKKFTIEGALKEISKSKNGKLNFMAIKEELQEIVKILD